MSKVTCVFQIRFSPYLNSKQQNVPTLSLDNKKKLLPNVKRAAWWWWWLTGCGKASRGFHHVWKEMRVRMHMYAREDDFSNKCRALNGVLRVCKRGYELAAAAAGACSQRGR